MRLTKKIFTDLAIWMAFLGVAVGVVFPFFIQIFGVSKDVALRPVFFSACVAAGILLAVMNYQLAKRVVGTRIKQLSKQMKHVEGILSDSETQGDCSKCSPETCSIIVDSEDELGDGAESFNRLIYTLSDVLGLQTDLQRFSELLTSHLELDTLCRETLLYLVQATHTNGGVILAERSGELEVVSSYGIIKGETAIVDTVLKQALQAPKRQLIQFPEDVLLDGVLTQFHPKELIVEPIIFKQVTIGFVVLAGTKQFTVGDLDKLSAYGSILAVAFNNALTHHQMQQLAAIDALTGIYNRRFGSNRIQEEFARTVRSGIPLSLIMLDIDHFKAINDTYGHMIGDKVIMTIAKCIKGAVREGDVVIRYGGEEFLCLLPGASGKDAGFIAERIRGLVKDTLYKSGDQEIHVTVSLGTATYPSQEIADTQQLIRLADTSMYKAKQNGRDCVVCA